VAGRYRLEISVESVEAAVAAERGGADRIELCSELAVGGLTPSAKLMTGTRANVQIPVFAMIRPRAGDFVYSAEELAAMRGSVEVAKTSGMNGVVLGVLTPERRVDAQRTRELVELARGMEVTFHRAFDECADQMASLEDVIQTGAERVLTSGGAVSAAAGAKTIAKLVAGARERIIILPGAGINAGNIAEVARVTAAQEFHSGLSSVLARGAAGEQFQAAVTRLAKELHKID
jgi:copper homeostasis protein